ncbi:MAG: glycoside hydrolase family 5 protein, partial [Proteobacteria bacterium]
KPVGNNFKGMHLGGGESGNLTDQNKYGYTFAYPSNTLIDYVARKGFGLIRLSFKAGRLQPDRNGALDPVELGRIDKVVQYAHSKGLYVLLDPHDYGSLPDADKSGKKIGSADMPASKFANFWAHVAAAYINQPNVLFGLINEPYGINARTWQSSAIAAVSAIRSVGAKQKIFIPGVSWTGAHSWISSGNAAVWANFHETNSVFEIHQYFDSDSSGTNATCSTNVGVKRFSGFTAWAEANSQKGFLGEVGWGANANCETEAEAAFDHMDSHPNAYLGWSYFGAGWYNGFMTLNPANLGQANEADQPQTTLILEHL